MLAKQYRLKKNKDFELTFKKGEALNGRFLFLKLRINNLEISRFGFVIGKKVSNKAVIRNKLKRQLREIIRNNLSNIKSGFDIIIIVKPGIVDRDCREVEEEAMELLGRAGLI